MSTHLDSDDEAQADTTEQPASSGSSERDEARTNRGSLSLAVAVLLGCGALAVFAGSLGPARYRVRIVTH